MPELSVFPEISANFSRNFEQNLILRKTEGKYSRQAGRQAESDPSPPSSHNSSTGHSPPPRGPRERRRVDGLLHGRAVLPARDDRDEDVGREDHQRVGH